MLVELEASAFTGLRVDRGTSLIRNRDGARPASRRRRPCCCTSPRPTGGPAPAPAKEAGSHLRLIDSCITQLKAQGNSRTCNESKEEEEEEEEEEESGAFRKWSNSKVHLAPPSPFFKNVKCVRETEIRVEQQPPQGVYVCDHAGLVINKCSP